MSDDGGRSALAELPPERQDEVLAAPEEGRLAGWNASVADATGFFATIRMHTILGFVLDPRHGGNRDYLGWQVMGYPGPAHHLGGARPDHMTGKVVFQPIWERQQREPRKPSHGGSEH